MRILIITCVCVIVATAGTAQVHDETQLSLIYGNVIASTEADPLTRAEVLAAIEDRFSLTAQELETLQAFSVAAQGNLSMVRQEGDGNLAILDQVGTGNVSVIIHRGTDNYTSAEQIGEGNVLGVYLDGGGNALGSSGEVGVRQYGDENVYLLEFSGDGHVIAPSIQEGFGNQAVQLGETALPFGIEQYGNGITLIIRHNE